MSYQSQSNFIRCQEQVKYESDPQKKKALIAEQGERLKSRQTAFGTVGFIGELYNVGIMKIRLMEMCIKELLYKGDNPTELSIECFHILIAIIGEKLESQEGGLKIIEEYQEFLERIVDTKVDNYSMSARYTILDVFEMRANGWRGPERAENQSISPSASYISIVGTNGTMNGTAQENTKIFRSQENIDEAFYAHLNDVLSNSKLENLLDFIDSFMIEPFTSDKRLCGAVKIVFEKAVSTPETSSMFAMLCKILSDVSVMSSDDEQPQGETFSSIIKILCYKEIEDIRQNAPLCRQITQRLYALKTETDKGKAHNMKSALMRDLNSLDRVRNFSTFIGELFNIDVIESRFIFDYFITLMTPGAVSNVFIESVCILLRIAGSKMLEEKNRKLLLTKTFRKLSEAANSIELSHRAYFLIKDLFHMGRFQLHLDLVDDTKDEFATYRGMDLLQRSTLDIKQEPLYPVGETQHNGEVGSGDDRAIRTLPEPISRWTPQPIARPIMVSTAKHLRIQTNINFQFCSLQNLYSPLTQFIRMF